MDTKLLLRLCAAKAIAKQLEPEAQELALWFIGYLLHDTGIPETYGRWIEQIENKDNALILKEIGLIKKLVDQYFEKYPEKKVARKREEVIRG